MAMTLGQIKVLITADSSGLQKGLANAQKSLGNFSKAATRVGQSLSLAVTAPLVLAGRQAIKTSNEFEMSMAKIEGLVGVAAEEVAKMGQEARKMAVATGQSATDAGDALFYITSAGLRGADAMSVLEQSLKASTAGLGEAATIADLATSALNAYGPANISATEATDVLTKAVREGKLETTELAGAMGRILPIAGPMGVSFNEVGAAFAAMSRTGTNAAEAATQLRGILTGILSPSKQAEDQLAAMGTSSAELRKQIKEEGLLSTLNTLKDLFGDNTEAAAMVFGNVRALSGIMDLLGANVDTTRQIFESLNDTVGATDAAFNAAAETAAFKFKEAQSNLTNASIEFGNALKKTLVPIIESFTESIQGVTEWFGKLSEGQQETIVKIGLFVAAAGPAILIAGQLAGAVRGLAGAFAFLTTSTMGYVALIGGLVLAIDSLIASFHKEEEAVRFTRKEMEAYNKAISETPTQRTAEEIKAGAKAFHQMRESISLTKEQINKMTQGELKEHIAALQKVKEGNEIWDYEKAQAQIAIMTARVNALTAAEEANAKAAERSAQANAAALEERMRLLQMYQDEVARASEAEFGLMMGAGDAGAGRLPIEGFTQDWTNLEPMEAPIDIEGSEEVFNRFQNKMEIVAAVAKQAASSIGEAFSAMGKSLFQNLTESENAFDRFMGGLGNAMMEILGMLLSNAVAWAISGAAQGAFFTGPLAPFTLPAFIASGTAAVLGAFSSIPKFAEGGLVTGPTLAMVGDNASGKEAIIPFEKMGAFMNMMGGTNVNVNITGELQGDALRLVVDRSNKDNLNLR